MLGAIRDFALAIVSAPSPTSRPRVHNDTELARLCSARADRFVGRRSLSPHHSWLLLQIGWRLARMRPVRLRVTEGEEGRLISRWLDRRSFGLQSPIHQAISLLTVERRSDPLAGSHFGTLRRMDRKAANAGIQCRVISDEDERQRLLQMAIDFERRHPDLRYRRAEPQTAGLEHVRLWLGAFASDGKPLVLCITPRSGTVALLRYFRTTESGEEATLARYALTAFLIHHLHRLRVRYLVDNLSPIVVGSPLRHFANMVGFRIARGEVIVRGLNLKR